MMDSSSDQGVWEVKLLSLSDGSDSKPSSFTLPDKYLLWGFFSVNDWFFYAKRLAHVYPEYFMY